MQDIVDWLISLEEIAGDFYRNAAEQFREDDKLQYFLEHLAEEEAWHFHVMGSAAQLLRTHREIRTPIKFDLAARKNIEHPVRNNYEKLSSGVLNKESLLECIVAMEYSEWNHIFLYVVNTLKHINKEFMYAASKIQQHMRGIEEFLETLPEGSSYINKIRDIPNVWENRILIVENYAPVLELLKVLLEKDGAIDTALSGEEGLNKLKSNYYNVIISDIEMPSMNGIEFYSEALKMDQEINQKFIFFTGTTDDKHLKFIHDNGIKYLEKPLEVSEMRRVVQDILHDRAVKS